jgi:putative membrane protein
MTSSGDRLPASDSVPTQPPRPAPRNSDHLANERTFLAWIRTSISMIGLGFVVAKFSVWLHELAARLDGPAANHRPTGMSLPLGVAMMGVGGLFAVMAAWRYRRVREAIESGESAAHNRTVTVVTLLVIAIAAALGVYMVATR